MQNHESMSNIQVSNKIVPELIASHPADIDVSLSYSVSPTSSLGCHYHDGESDYSESCRRNSEVSLDQSLLTTSLMFSESEMQRLPEDSRDFHANASMTRNETVSTDGSQSYTASNSHCNNMQNGEKYDQKYDQKHDQKSISTNYGTPPSNSQSTPLSNNLMSATSNEESNSTVTHSLFPIARNRSLPFADVRFSFPQSKLAEKRGTGEPQHASLSEARPKSEDSDSVSTTPCASVSNPQENSKTGKQESVASSTTSTDFSTLPKPSFANTKFLTSTPYRVPNFDSRAKPSFTETAVPTAVLSGVSRSPLPVSPDEAINRAELASTLLHSPCSTMSGKTSMESFFRLAESKSGDPQFWQQLSRTLEERQKILKEKVKRQ